MKKSISTRIKITGTGKIIRRPMGIGHSKAKKSGVVNQQKRKSRNLEGVSSKFLTRYI
ncbi:MAG: 50S ribosomal protein L35 [Patescibacteria group bacterium]